MSQPIRLLLTVTWHLMFFFYSSTQALLSSTSFQPSQKSYSRFIKKLQPVCNTKVEWKLDDLPGLNGGLSRVVDRLAPGRSIKFEWEDNWNTSFIISQRLLRLDPGAPRQVYQLKKEEKKQVSHQICTCTSWFDCPQWCRKFHFKCNRSSSITKAWNCNCSSIPL